MKIAVFNTKSYDRQFLQQANEAAGAPHSFTFYEHALHEKSAVLAKDHEAVCVFVNDTLDAACLSALANNHVHLVALRCAGFNNVDMDAAREHQIRIVRVPEYSPHAVAEHTLALLLALNRRIHRAYARIKEGNYSIEGLLGFDLYQRTVGIIGTGKIGSLAAKLFLGFGCRVLAHDVRENEELKKHGVEYRALDDLWKQASIFSLHCPLTPETTHLIRAETIQQMPQGAYIVNTSRGALVDARAAIDGLKNGQIGGLALDVYEEESGVFFEDHSSDILDDDLLARLTTFPNVLITSHQAFFTQEALLAISNVTIHNLNQFAEGKPLDNAL
mgnify:CR=1 FL=1